MSWHQSVEPTLNRTGLDSMCLFNKLAGRCSLGPQGHGQICQKLGEVKDLLYNIIQTRDRRGSLLRPQNFTFLHGKGLNFLGGRYEKLFPW